MTLVRRASIVVLNSLGCQYHKVSNCVHWPPVPVLVLVLKSRAPLAEMLRVVRDPYHSASFNLSTSKTHSLESGVPGGQEWATQGTYNGILARAPAGMQIELSAIQVRSTKYALSQW